ncbi:plastocyanin/azurin family copper-binding protein [Halobacteria archaeon AArc-dxtr1]|nr:plastocyanin/azurin family copper-binding protein [Halobacteria archaeon AArc-dxtr1]
MRRRYVLASSVGLLVGSAGCLDEVDVPRDDDDAEDDTNGNKTDEDDDGDTNGEAANFEVLALDQATIEVTGEEPIDVHATVTNTGDRAGERTVRLWIGTDVVSTREISLEPGEEETVSFEDVALADFGPGEYTILVTSGNTETTGTLLIEQSLDPDDWADVTSVRLLAHSAGWIGVEPTMIEGVENPTVLLSEGVEYELTWEEDDCSSHNIELRDVNDQVVGEYVTPIEGGCGVTQSLTFEADSDMQYYVCDPHASSMRGRIELA